MSVNKALLLSVALLLVLTAGAVGLRFVGPGSAAAQTMPGAPVGPLPAPESGAPPQPPMPPPMPDMPGMPGQELLPVEEALEQARAADLAVRQTGLANLVPHYTTRGAPEREEEIEAVLREAAEEGETPGIRSMGLGGLAGRMDRNGDYLARLIPRLDREQRLQAMENLAWTLPSEPIIRLLEQAVQSPDTELATIAVDALTKNLARMGVEGTEPLIRMLSTTRVDANAKAALQLLQIGRPAIPALLSTLAQSPNQTQRHGAAVTIAMLAGGRSERQEAFGERVQAVRHADPDVPEPALEALEGLVRALREDSAGLVREICAQALGYLGDERAAPALAQALTQDPEPEVRVRAAAALVLVPGEAALAALERAVQHDRSARVRRFAVEALGWTGDRRGAGALVFATRDADVEVRLAAAQQLGNLQAPGTVEALVALFQDPDEDVRWYAVRAVERLRDRRAVDALVRATRDPSVLVSNAAQNALQRLGLARVHDPLAAGARDAAAEEWGQY